MTKMTVTSRDFNQDITRAKRFALEQPLFITDRGKTTHVLMSIDEYRRLTGQNKTLSDLLGHKEAADIDIEFEKLDSPLTKPVEF